MVNSDPMLVGVTLGNRNTLLHLAAKQGQVKTAKYLLRHTQIDIGARNIFNQTAFQLAFNEGNLSVCEIIRRSSPEYLGGSGLQYDDSELYAKQHATHSGSNSNFTSDNDSCSIRRQGFKFKDVFVHVDLKGAPPVFDFLMRYLEFIVQRHEYLVTGFIFEFEDMFPFEGHLKSAASPKAYSKEQIRSLVSFLKRRKLKVAVLV